MSKKSKSPKLKIMIASTIHGFEDHLDQICAMFQGYQYEVWNSHFRTIPVHPGLSNTDNCLKAVESCDVFFGIIRRNKKPFWAIIPDTLSPVTCSLALSDLNMVRF